MPTRRTRNARPKPNGPCWCGSGKKLKKCHTGPAPTILPADPQLLQRAHQIARRHEAHEHQRREQQGHGKPIIAADFKDHKFVAVGNQIRWGKWVTFEDFLTDYLRSVFGREWYEAEIAKKIEARHPLLSWFDDLAKSRQGSTGPPGTVHTQAMSPAIARILGLAYNLYLLAHNAKLHEFLVQRLKRADQFFGATYETYVAAWCVRSGLSLELEDETDVSRSHCEFTATNRESGRRYSVEAKARKPGAAHLSIRRQLERALAKTTAHDRIVFIEVSADPTLHPPLTAADDLSDQLRTMESRKIPKPSSYIVFTNQPFAYDEKGHSIGRFAMVDGFRMADWGGAATPVVGALAAFKRKQRHLDVIRLGEAFHRYTIPSTFDGEAPDLAFGHVLPRLLVGNQIEIEFPDGTKVSGEITTGCVDESNSSAMIGLRNADGTALVTVPLTKEELAAYRRHPKTFFGEMSGDHGHVNGPLDLFEFMYSTYSQSHRDHLLEFMKDAPDIERLREMSQEELALEYCARVVEAEMASGHIPVSGQGGPRRITGTPIEIVS